MAARNPWAPGFITRMPWLPVAGFLLSVVGLAAAAAILVYSDGKPIAEWRFQPPTYLAIATVVTNVCLFYVLKEGANIAWWHQATRSTTIGELHRHYLFGSSFQDAILSGRHLNFIALACIVATVAQINSPLLQRASKAVVEPLLTSLPINLSLYKTVPDTYFTGYVSGRAYDASLFSEDFAPVVMDFNNNASISVPQTGCKGSCSTSVEGLGLALNCSSYTIPYDLILHTYDNGSVEFTEDSANVGIDVYQSDFRWNVGNPWAFEIGVAYKSSFDCTGELIVQNCSLRTATVRYQVLVDGNASTITLDPHTDIFSDVVLEEHSSGALARQGGTTFGGYWLALQNKFGSRAHMRFTGAVGYTFTSVGNMANQYAVVNGTRTGSPNVAIGSSCDLYFRNPMTELLAGARNLMFRISLAASNETTPIQSVTATQSDRRAVFRTQYAYMGGAFALTLAALFMSACLFKGYSSLGRKMTMSPVEIAKAFNAPLLAGSDSNATVKSLIKQAGTRNVMYGVAMESPPVHGYEYEQHVHEMSGNNEERYKQPFVRSEDAWQADGTLGRLQMGADQQVRAPRKGEVFSG